jgi:hypothetical protein
MLFIVPEVVTVIAPSAPSVPERMARVLLCKLHGYGGSGSKQSLSLE